jgi:hypothetical protein
MHRRRADLARTIVFTVIVVVGLALLYVLAMADWN